MMIAISILTGLGLIVTQTVILPFFFHVVHGYDLMLILVVYLGFHRSPLASLPVVMLLGSAMDCFSGGPFGIYLTTYFWLYVGLRGVTQFLHVNSLIVLPLAFLAGVLMENLIVAITLFLGNLSVALSWDSLVILAVQLIWVFITGPVVYVIIKTLHHAVDQWFTTHFGRGKTRSDFPA